MKLTDILPVEQWLELEEEIFARSGLNPNIYDENGVSITKTGTTHNSLCHEIKASPMGQTSICSASHHHISQEAKKSYDPVVGVCKSGLLKIVVPIYVGVTFVGAAGGCGLVPEGGQIQNLFVSQTLDMDNEKVEVLAQSVPGISNKNAQAVANYIKERIDGIIAIYMLMQNNRDSHERRSDSIPSP